MNLKRKKIIPKPMSEIVTEVQVNGLPEDTTGFGVADGKLKLHITSRETDGMSQGVKVAGFGPYTVHLFHDSNPFALPGFIPYKVIENIPVCVDFTNDNIDPLQGPVAEFNCTVEGLPAGNYTGRVFDARMGTPEEGEARFISGFMVVQPPKVTIGMDVNPGGEPTTVQFHFGLTPEYGRVAGGGTPNGPSTILCTVDLKCKREGSQDPTEFLEPNTVYHWKGVATNSMGTSETEDQVFTTPSYTHAPVITNPRVISMI
jgi:hypothetical protein